MNSSLTFTILLITFSALGQEISLNYTDGKKVIEHPTCQMWVGDLQKITKRILTYDHMEVLRAKGFTPRILTQRNRDGKELDANDMLLDIRVSRSSEKNLHWEAKAQLYGYAHNPDADRFWNQYHKVPDVPLIEASSWSSGITNYKEDPYRTFRPLRNVPGENAISKTLEMLPDCSKEYSPLETGGERFRLQTRLAELNVCSELYDKELNRLERLPRRQMNKLAGFASMGITAGGVLFPPLAFVGAGTFALSNLNVVSRLKQDSMIRMMRDGRMLIEDIKSCEINRVRGEDCELEARSASSYLNRRSNRFIKKLIQRAGMSEFSRRVADEIVTSQVCANPDLKRRKRTLKKIIKRARHNF